MSDFLAFLMFLTLIVVGLVVAVLSAIWWVVSLIAFPIIYVGALGVVALHDSWKRNRKRKQR